MVSPELDNEVFQRTASAYKQRCDANGWIYQEPDHDESVLEEGNVITLRNVSGVLARYRVVDERPGDYHLEWVE